MTVLPTDIKIIVDLIKRSNKNLTSTWDFGTYHILANILDPLIAHDADAIELSISILV